MQKDGNFEFYELNVRQDINRQKNRVTGNKSFSYFLIPKEPGQYKMKDYFHWVFFNPAKKRYDSLQPKLVFTVTGESKKNEAIQANDLQLLRQDRYGGQHHTQDCQRPLAEVGLQRVHQLLHSGAAAFYHFPEVIRYLRLRMSNSYGTFLKSPPLASRMALPLASLSTAAPRGLRWTKSLFNRAGPPQARPIKDHNAAQGRRHI